MMPMSTSRSSWDKVDVGSEFDAFKLATHLQEPSLGVPPGGLPGGRPGVPPGVPGTRWMLSVCVWRNMKSYENGSEFNAHTLFPLQ